MSRTLKQVLSDLSSVDSSQGIWVDPDDPINKWRFGQRCFPNGGEYDSWIYIGSLENLSFGFQSQEEAFCSWISSGVSDQLSRLPEKSVVNLSGKTIHTNPKDLWEIYCNEREKLDPEFAKALQKELDMITQEWIEQEVDFFLSDTLITILENSRIQHEQT